MPCANPLPSTQPRRGPVTVMAALSVLVSASGSRADDGADDESSRVEAWIERTEQALEEAHRPHIALRTGPLDEPRTRTTTGTSWLPDTAPTYALIFPVRRWGMIVRGNVFAGYAWGSSPRGAKGAMTANTLLLSAIGGFGAAELVTRCVLSWEAYTLSRGQPAPLQGEGGTLHDRQAPRRLLHELAAQVTVRLASNLALQLYAAAYGAPALGPPDPAFRPSGFFDPVQPLSYASLGSAHALPGVLTAGWVTDRIKLEGSWFGAAERRPPSHGSRFALPTSGSVRLQVLPRPAWALSGSYGHVHDPWLARALDRWLVSAMWSRGDEDSGFNLGLVAGVNRIDAGALEPAALVEWSWTSQRHHTFFGRVESLRESGARRYGQSFAWSALGSLSAGYVYAFRPLAALAPSLGVRGQVTALSRSLSTAYGGRVAGGFSVYAQLRQVSTPRARRE